MQFTSVTPAMCNTILEMKLGSYKYRKLELIREVQNMTGLGFRDSKDLVEAISRNQ